MRLQQRRGFLRRGQQDELPVAAVRVQVQVIAQLVADLRRIARDVDVEILKSGGFARQMRQRPAITIHQRGRGHLDEIAEHQAHSVAPDAAHVERDRLIEDVGAVEHGAKLFGALVTNAQLTLNNYGNIMYEKNVLSALQQRAELQNIYPVPHSWNDFD